MICPKCGLPKELCVCESIAKEHAMIRVYREAKKFNKVYTIVEGLDSKMMDINDIAKALKEKFACGGTVKDGKIELQGDHTAKIKEALSKIGFAPETIEVR